MSAASLADLSKSVLVIGVDPGATTGMFAQHFHNHRTIDAPVAIQVHGAHAVHAIVNTLREYGTTDLVVVAVEAFVVNNRAGRSAHGNAGGLARDIIASLTERSWGWQVSSHTAAQVKPWATDRRLDAAKFTTSTAGMRHARDAARHCLYVAVRNGWCHDPLSQAAIA